MIYNVSSAIPLYVQQRHTDRDLSGPQIESLYYIVSHPFEFPEKSQCSYTQDISFIYPFVIKNVTTNTCIERVSEDYKKYASTTTNCQSKKQNLHLLVLVLYKIRNPHCRHRTGSPPLMTLRAPQSPHRYSTPLIMGIAVPVVCANVPPGVDMFRELL